MSLLTTLDFAHLDIPAVVERYTSTRLHAGRTQCTGACPYEDCSGDTDGFIVFYELSKQGRHFYCRTCRRSGDIVKLLQGILNKPYREVCALLEIGQGKPAMPRRQVTTNAWQKKELAFLTDCYPYLRRGLLHDRACAYLHQRGIPLETAQEHGVCYIPPYKEMDAQTQDAWFHMRLWTDRLVFPLSDGGFTGRALALLAGGIDDAIAASRNGIRCEDIPVKVLSATLAYDSDAKGQEAARRDEKIFRRKGIRTIRCTPAEDTQVKDWSARYRLQGKEGLRHLRTVLQEQEILLCSVCGKDATATDEIFFFDEHGCAFCPVHWSSELSPLDALLPAYDGPTGQTLLPASPLETTTEGHGDTVAPASIEGVVGEPEPVVEPSSLEGYYQTAEQVLALAAHFPESEQLVLDLETTGLDPRRCCVVTLAIGTPGQVAVIDLRGYYAADAVRASAWRDALQQLLHRDVLWMGHNLKFDWSFLAQQFGVKLTRVYDTMLVEKLLHAGEHVSASLLASAERYGMAVTKEQRSWFIDLDTRPAEWAALLPEAQLAYIRQDIEVPYQIWERQQGALAQRD